MNEVEEPQYCKIADATICSGIGKEFKSFKNEIRWLLVSNPAPGNAWWSGKDETLIHSLTDSHFRHAKSVMLWRIIIYGSRSPVVIRRPYMSVWRYIQLSSRMRFYIFTPSKKVRFCKIMLDCVMLPKKRLPCYIWDMVRRRLLSLQHFCSLFSCEWPTLLNLFFQLVAQ